MSRDIRLKQGATLSLAIAFEMPDLSALDLTPYTLACQVRDLYGNLVADVPVVVDAPQSGLAHAIVPSTAGWPVGILRSDILLSAGGYTAATDTFGIVVERPVTQLGVHAGGAP